MSMAGASLAEAYVMRAVYKEKLKKMEMEGQVKGEGAGHEKAKKSHGGWFKKGFGSKVSSADSCGPSSDDQSMPMVGANLAEAYAIRAIYKEKTRKMEVEEKANGRSACWSPESKEEPWLLVQDKRPYFKDFF